MSSCATRERRTGPTVNHTTSGPREQQLIVLDINTVRCFLVDTGAHVSVVPASRLDRRSEATKQQLRDPEHKYSTYDRELLALYLAVRHFRFLTEGRNIRMFTDHKPLVDAISKTSDPWTPRQQRQLAFIS